MELNSERIYLNLLVLVLAICNIISILASHFENTMLNYTFALSMAAFFMLSAKIMHITQKLQTTSVKHTTTKEHKKK
ncbi:MAG: hypothetical protein KKD39_02305 [Candidatus Altiarchaeota archaeon]|nr:hypothetical protein [Candidatus Altiarchaeota archaeon]